MWPFKKKKPVNPINFINGFLIPPPNHPEWKNRYRDSMYTNDIFTIYYHYNMPDFCRLSISDKTVATGDEVQKMGQKLYIIFWSRYLREDEEALEKLRQEVNNKAAAEGYYRHGD